MKNKKNKTFYCGTSNVVLPVPNKTHFPEEYKDKSRLNYYASLFNTVEINSSFYKIPMRRTVEKWATDVPDNFRITFKLWKGITHAKELMYNEAYIHRFMDAVNGVGPKKGCLLLQLPPSIKASYGSKIKRLLDQLYTNDEIEQWKVAIEFRDRSWYNDTTYEMMEEYKSTIVIHDMPASATPFIDMDTHFSYFRFHGEKGDYRGSYEDDILHEHAANMTHLLKKGQTVFAYFNNTMGNAVSNALILNRDMK